jgi:hypothetical protein
VPQDQTPPGEILQWCNTCFRETQHDIRAQDALAAESGNAAATRRTTLVLRCRGCGSWSIRTDIAGPDGTFSEREPPRQWRRPPEWLPHLAAIDADLGSLLEEVYIAANSRQLRLLSMGVRAALDHTMVRMIGDVGPFEKKLEEMQAKGYLSPRQHEMLAMVIDVGSATMHRGYRPPEDLLPTDAACDGRGHP